ncbi:hypothetical protein BZJ21_12165, partial [Salinivibrio costicola subsp. alcaliphilus]
HSTQANDVRDGPRVLSDRAGKPFMTRMFMRFPCFRYLNSCALQRLQKISMVLVGPFLFGFAILIARASLYAESLIVTSRAQAVNQLSFNDALRY